MTLNLVGARRAAGPSVSQAAADLCWNFHLITTICRFMEHDPQTIKYPVGGGHVDMLMSGVIGPTGQRP